MGLEVVGAQNGIRALVFTHAHFSKGARLVSSKIDMRSLSTGSPDMKPIGLGEPQLQESQNPFLEKT